MALQVDNGRSTEWKDRESQEGKNVHYKNIKTKFNKEG